MKGRPDRKERHCLSHGKCTVVATKPVKTQKAKALSDLRVAAGRRFQPPAPIGFLPSCRERRTVFRH